MRLVTDTIEFGRGVPGNTISISGYHIRRPADRDQQLSVHDRRRMAYTECRAIDAACASTTLPLG
jgi:hypothetical protein